MEVPVQVSDIVRRSAANSGVVSSFNPDEIPEDIENTGFFMLRDDVLPSINADRNVDITQVAYQYTPVNNKIILKVPPKDVLIIGNSAYTSTELLEVDSYGHQFVITEVSRIIPSYVLNWPQDDFGNYFDLHIWGSDKVLVHIPSSMRTALPIVGATVTEYNIDFPPMRVVNIFSGTSRGQMLYVYREEFESGEYIHNANVYATEEYEDSLIIHFHNSPELKTIILPVPLSIIKTTNDTTVCSGTINCPPKFKQYLVDLLSFRMAVFYGVSTAPAMQELSVNSYKLLGKNMTQPLHSQNINKQIRKYTKGGYRR